MTRFLYVVWALVLLPFAPDVAAAQRLGTEFGVVPPEMLAVSVTGVSLAWDGSEYVLVYTNETTGETTTRFAVLGPMGELVRAPDVLIPLRSGQVECFAGDCILVSGNRVDMVGTTPVTTRGVFAVRFRTDGTLIDTSPLVLAELAPPVTFIQPPTVARTASGYLMTWEETEGVSTSRYMAPIPLAGEAGARVVFPSGTEHLACHGASCLFARTSFVPGVGETTYVQIVAESGVALTSPVELATGGWVNLVADSGLDYVIAEGILASPAPRRWRVAYDGTVTVSSAPPPLMSQRISCDGAGGCLLWGGSFRWWRADDVIVTGAGSSSGVTSAMCRAPGTCAALRPGGALQPVTFDGTALTVGTTGARPAAPAARSHGGPIAVASDGSTHLALFGESTSTILRLGAAWASEAGPLAGAGPSGITLAPGVLRTWMSRGSGAYGLLTARGGTEPLQFRLLDDAGVPTFGPVDVFSRATVGAIAWNGVHYMAVWASSIDLRMQRFDAIGQRVDDVPVVLRTGSFQNIEVAWDGVRWVILTREGPRTKVMRLDADGTPLDAPTGVLVRDHAGSDAQLAVSGGLALAVWQDQLPTGGVELRAARISVDGEVLDLGGWVVASAAAPLTGVDVTFDGARFVVGWGVLDDTSTSEPARILVRARTVSLDARMGMPVDVLDQRDAGLRSMVPAYTFGSLVALSSSSPGRTLIFYQRQMTSITEAPVRWRARAFTDDSLGAVCGGGADCDSGVCSGGVCCDRRCDGACEACGADGLCVPSTAGVACRDAAGMCDSPEVCDGVVGTCPVATVMDCDGGVTVVDAGMPGASDAGTPDAAAMAGDGGHEDAGGITGRDGGPPTTGDMDASTMDSDAGVTGPPTRDDGGACSVSGVGNASSPASGFLFLFAAALALGRRRFRL